MVTCNRFEIDLTVFEGKDPTITYLLITDLPAGTLVIMSCQREYLDRNGERSLWIGAGGRIAVLPSVQHDLNGFHGEVVVAESDKQALTLFREINHRHGPGISSPVSDAIELDFVVGARQRLREFGKNNCHLQGSMVSLSGEIHIVHSSKSVSLPMKAELQPANAFTPTVELDS